MHVTCRFHGNHILTGMFFKILISLSLKIKGSFLVAFFKSEDHFMMFLFVLITFDSILGDIMRFWTNPEIQDGGPRWPPLRNDYAIFTSCNIIASRCVRHRRHFRTYYLPFNSRFLSFYILGVTEGGGPNPSPPVVEDQKKPGLNRVKGAVTWNSLPTDIRITNSFYIFKSNLKEYIQNHHV